MIKHYLLTTTIIKPMYIYVKMDYCNQFNLISLINSRVLRITPVYIQLIKETVYIQLIKRHQKKHQIVSIERDRPFPLKF